MANIAAIRSVGTSLAAYLTRAYDAAAFTGVTKPACTFTVQSIGRVGDEDAAPNEAAVRVLILLYRVSMNEHLRNVGRLADPSARPVPVSVDLRYLISFWSQSSDNEQIVLAWTLRQLHEVPVLDRSILSADAAWAPDEVVQLIPEEISTEDMMRIWDSLQPTYRLSLSYIARVVRIDPDQARTGRPVVATRFTYETPTPEQEQ